MFTAIKNRFVQKTAEEKGATAVEYGMIVGLIAAVIVAIVFTLGGDIQGGFQDVSDQIQAAGN